MDACDPGIDYKNLKTLIKQNTGHDLKLSRKQICEVYATTQDGKLPLPPLILSSDRTFMLDRKSPLTRMDFDKLFNSTTKVSSIRRIAKKVGVARHADTKLTKAQLIDIIGRRLHSMNILEPIKLRSLQAKKVMKFNSNNVPFGNNVNRINTGNRNLKQGNNNQKTGIERPTLSGNNNQKTGIERPTRSGTENNNNKNESNIYNDSKLVNRGKISLYEKYHRKNSGNATLSNSELAAYKADRRKFYLNTPENAYTKLRAQGKIETGFTEFKKLFQKGKDKYTGNVNTGKAKELENNDNNNGISRPKRKGKLHLNKPTPEPVGGPNSLPPTKENRQKLVNNKKDPISLWLNENAQKNGFGNLYNHPESKNIINEAREKYVKSGKSKTGDISRILSTLRGKNPRPILRGQNAKLNANIKKLRNFLQNKNINNGRKALYEGKVRNGSNVDAVINMIKQQLEKSNSSNTIPNKPVNVQNVPNKPVNVPNVPKSKLDTNRNTLTNYLKNKNVSNNAKTTYLKMLNNGTNVNKVKKQIETDITQQRKSTENVIAFNKYLENKNVNKNTYRNRLKKGEPIEKLKSEIGNLVTQKRQKEANKNALTQFLNNKNVPNKNTYFANLNRGKPIVEIKKAIMNKQTEIKNKEEMNKRVQEISVLLNSNNSLKNNANVKAILNNYATGRKQKIKGWLFNTNGNVMYKNINSVKGAINTMKKELALKNEINAKKTNINMYVNSKGLKNPKKIKKGALAQINKGANVNTVKSSINLIANQEKAANEAAEAKRIKKEEAAEAKRIKNEEAAEAKRIKNEEAAEAKRIRNEEAAAEAQRKKNEEERKKQEARNAKAKNLNTLTKILDSQNSNNRIKMNNSMKTQYLSSFNKGQPLSVLRNKASKYFKNKQEAAKKKNETNQKRKLQRNTLKQILNSKNGNVNIKLNNATKDKHLTAFNSGGNFNRVKANAIKSIQNKQTAKEKRLAEEAKLKAQKENKQRKLQILTQILNSKNGNANVKLNNARKANYLQQFNKNPNTFNIIKGKITKEIRNKVDAKTKKAAEAEKKRTERQQLEQLLKTSNSINTTYYIGLFNKGQSYNAVKKQIDNKLANIKRRKNAANELKKQQENAKKAAEELKRKEEEARRKAMENQMYLNQQSQLEAQKAANEARKAKEEAVRKAEEAKKMKEQKRVQDKKVIQSMIQKAGGISINGASYLSKLNANTYNFDSIKKALIANIKTKKNAKKAINITKQKENASKQNIVRKNLELRKGLERKVQRAQFKNNSDKRKLLNQIKNTKTMTAKELQPKINKAIKELSLNGNINEKEEKRKRDQVKKQVSEYISKTYPKMNRAKRTNYISRANSYREGSGLFYRMRPQSYNAIRKMINQNMKPPPPPKNKKANLKKLVNNTLKGRAGKNAERLKKNINEGVSEMTVKTRLAQLNKRTKYQTK
tara:strand:+ start:2581 stop:6885 length:4305 start_codon:yes stop_codon:yes gene_type:complete